MYDLQTRVRLDVGLAHAVPGVRLELHCRGGNLIEVGGGRVGVPAVCQVRSALGETGSSESAFFAEHLRSIVVGGALYSCGADLYGRESPQGRALVRHDTLVEEVIAHSLLSSEHD